MTSGVSLEFIPARRPEAIRMDVSRYKIIKPKGQSQPKHKADADARENSEEETDGSSSEEDEDYGEEFYGMSKSDDSSVDSMEDSEKSDTDDSSSSEFTEETSDQKHTLQDYETPDKKHDSKVEFVDKRFYDINENASDRGSRSPKRIHKSWHASARSPVGLINRGVTCYINSAVQAILHLPAVGRYLLEVLNGSHPKVNSGSVTHDLAALFKKMMEKKSPVTPSKLLKRLPDINPMLDEWQQEDSHEFYMSLLSRLQEDSVPRGEKLRSSIIHDIFGGSVEQKVTCQRCMTVSTTTQDFYDLPVSFSQHESEGHYTLERSVQDFFTPETITASEKGTGYQCEKCRKKTKAIKKIAISEAPEYLTVHIKRFKMDGNISKKVKDTLSYPIEMSLTQYEKDDSHELRYRLIAVIAHEGRTVSSGHYIALARQPNNGWMMYDDELTRPIPESYVKSHPSAYILLYSRLLEKPHTSGRPAKNSVSKEAKQAKKVVSKSAQEPSANGKISANSDSTPKLKSKQKVKSKSKTSKLPPLATGKENAIAAKASRRSSADAIEDIFGKSKKRKTMRHN